ncbi:MAG: hypothetical protein IPQ07_44815 [Myxococcales bacterium]|nr:hypothetical protein [Myxococcales bacterium]
MPRAPTAASSLPARRDLGESEVGAEVLRPRGREAAQPALGAAGDAIGGLRGGALDGESGPRLVEVRCAADRPQGVAAGALERTYRAAR